MRGSDKTGRFRDYAPVTQARHRDVDIYHRYAVGLYRQALFGALAHVRASRAPEIGPRDTTSLVRAVLGRLTTSLAATGRREENDAETRLCHGNHHGSHAGPDGAQVIAGCATLPGDEKDVTAK
jgi:hypothetical protein